MEKTFNNIESYLLSVQEQYGNDLYFDKSTIIRVTEVVEELKTKTEIKVEVSKNETEIIESNEILKTNWSKSKTIDELNNNIKNCMNCPLGATRNKFVFGTGNPNADIMIIGEAPGADEDEQGEPFVGRAGQLLTKILAAINLTREEVFIANILKCRPPENRKPLPSEEDECEPYLQKQIELIKPQFILALGLTAIDRLLKKKHKMGDIRGSVLEYHGIKMLVTYHPAALLRNPNWKVQTWEDVKLLRKLYDEYLQTVKR
jgi:DNA polymerase